MTRFFDIILSITALVVLLPILVPVALILCVTGEREVLFLQDRIGLNGKNFRLIKFATMRKDSPNIGTGTVTMKDDPRVLPVGKILRKSKVNELPQLFNVLAGDMSVIGPRPLTAQTFGSYSFITKQQIIKVRPGLSGLGSIIFRREEEIMHGQSASIDFYNEVIAPYKGILEEWYIANRGIKMYFLAIFLTVWVILSPNTQLQWKIFKRLPDPPSALKKELNYPN